MTKPRVVKKRAWKQSLWNGSSRPGMSLATLVKIMDQVVSKKRPSYTVFAARTRTLSNDFNKIKLKNLVCVLDLYTSY